MARSDLLLIALGGVQQFIAESRTTTDLAGASGLVQRLVQRAADSVAADLATAAAPCGLVFPTPGSSGGVTNKIAALAPAGAGAGVARHAAEAVRHEWTQLVSQVHGASAPTTPGSPDLSWVAVEGDADADYDDLWKRAQEALVARRRMRPHVPFVEFGCALSARSPRLPAVTPPPRTRRHEREEALSAEGWVKRMVGRSGGEAGFPATSAIAATTFRARLLAAVPAAELVEPLQVLRAGVRTVADWDVADDAEPDDAAALLSRSVAGWLHDGPWERAARAEPEDPARLAAGREAARELRRVADRAEVPPLTPYYAVIVQDLDRLGRSFGLLGLADQRVASGALRALGVAQRAAAEDRAAGAVTVYAGGDDFLALGPSAGALALAGRVRVLVDEHLADSPLSTAQRPLTASTAVVLAHMSSPLGETVGAAREALALAKSAEDWFGKSRDALAVVVRRRGGERARAVLPWTIYSDSGPATAAELLADVLPAPEAGALSAGLSADLERDREALAGLAADESLDDVLKAEITRLVLRRGGSTTTASAAVRLGRSERAGRRDPDGKPWFDPAPSLLVARFLAQEAR